MSLWDMVRGRGQAATPRHAPTVDAGLPLSFGPAGGRPLAQSVVPGEGLLITTPAELEAALRGESSGSGEIVTPEMALRSEEQTSEIQSLMRISYAVLCLKKKKQQ